MRTGFDAWTAAAELARGRPLDAALDTTDARAWTALDLAVRDHEHYATAVRLPVVRPSGPPPGISQLAVALCHPDGRVREAALRPASRTPALLPLIVVRCADWAAPVRALARAVLSEGLPSLASRAEPRSWATVCAVVMRVAPRRWGGFARDLLEETLRSGPRVALGPLLTSYERPVRRLAHRMVVERGLLSPPRLARIAASDSDVVVQDLCVQAAIAEVGDGAYDEVLRLLLGARSPRVRSTGLTALKRAGRARDAEAYLADRSALVRACARWVLRQAGTDPLPLYRALCTEPAAQRLSPGAVSGLAECGTRADAGLLWPLLTHPRPAVRARAVAGLSSLDVADACRIRPLLDDAAPGVARQAAAALAPSARRVPEEWLAERLAASLPRHTRTAAFRVLCAQGGTAELRAALRLFTDADPKLRTRARTIVGRWGPSFDGAATEGDGEDLAALIEQRAPDLGTATVTRLRWLLRIGR